MNSIYIKQAIRKLLKNPFISMINLLGIAIGLAAFIIISYYIDFETGYDDFHADTETIYRVESSFLPVESETQRFSTSSHGYGPAMKKEIPEVLDFCRFVIQNHQRDIRYQDKIFREDNVMMVDSNVFNFFSFPLIEGNANKVLSDPNTMVISQSAAYKYFKNENPIGKVMEVKTLNENRKYTVSGIFKDIPKNSHLQFNFLLSYRYDNDFFQNTWYMHETFLYVKANSDKEARIIEKKFTEISEKYKTRPALKDKKWVVDLVPLNNIWLMPAKTYETTKGNRQAISILKLIAIMILAMGWLNFFNLSNTKNLESIQESYINRLNGAKYWQIGRIFLNESFIMNFLGVLLSLLIILISQPLLENYLESKLFYHFWQTPFVWTVAALALIIGTLINGVAPAFIVIRLLKSKYSRSQSVSLNGDGKMRASLVIAQYAIAIVFITGTILVKKQVNFLQNQDLGVDIEQTLTFTAPTSTQQYGEKIRLLSNEMLSLADVKSFTGSSAVPGVEVAHLLSNARADDPEKRTNLYEMLRVDEHFLSTFDLPLVCGRNFSSVGEHENNSLILNETSAKLLGFNSYEESIGKEIMLEGLADRRFKIIGIVKNYHHMSLKEGIKPIILFCSNNAHRWIRTQYYSAKIQTANMQNAIGEIEAIYKKHFPAASFNYTFLDDTFDQQYRSDIQFAKLFAVFTGLAIFIVCLGLMGLSSFILLKRTKEIGVRKVNGAKSIQILQLLNSRFVTWIGISFLIAGPLSAVVLKYWLKNFVLHTQLSWWIFAVALFSVGLLTILIVSLLSWKTASQNPVRALRYE